VRNARRRVCHSGYPKSVDECLHEYFTVPPDLRRALSARPAAALESVPRVLCLRGRKQGATLSRSPGEPPHARIRIAHCRRYRAPLLHEDRYDRGAVEKELDSYDARRGKDWSGDKVRQYSRVMRADFGAHVGRKRYRLV